MRTSAVPVSLLLGCLLGGLVFGVGPPPRAVPIVDPTKPAHSALFDTNKVWTATLTIGTKDFERMPPPKRAPGKGGPVGPRIVRPGGKGIAGGFNLAFTYVPASFEFDGKTYADVAVRYKGNSSYTSAPRGAKRPFKIDFNRLLPGGTFFGLTKINLNTNAMDPTQLREALAYAVYRAAGLPAPRTTFVKLFLGVPGKYEKEYLGLYTLVEDIDKHFLRDRFGSARSLLVKPENMRGIEYLGEKWEPYESKYLPRTKATDASKKRLQRLAWLIDKGDDATFAKEIRSFVDLDNFLKFVAVTGLVSNLDSFIGLGHNYYMYLDPRSNKFNWIPWDLNLAFAGMPFGGSGAEQMRLSVDHPHIGDLKLIDRLFAIAEVKKDYHVIVRRLVADVYNDKKLLPLLDQMKKEVAGPIDLERKALTLEKPNILGAFAFELMVNRPELQTFITKRSASVLAQLDGKEKGHVPFPPSFFGMGARPNPAIALARKIITQAKKDKKLTKAEATTAVDRLFATLDPDKKGRIDEKAIADFLSKHLPDKRPGEFAQPSLAETLAKALFAKAKPDADNKVTLDEMRRVAEALFAEADKNKDGTLDERELVAILGRLLPTPAVAKK